METSQTQVDINKTIVVYENLRERVKTLLLELCTSFLSIQYIVNYHNFVRLNFGFNYHASCWNRCINYYVIILDYGFFYHSFHKYKHKFRNFDRFRNYSSNYIHSHNNNYQHHQCENGDQPVIAQKYLAQTSDRPSRAYRRRAEMNSSVTGC